MSRAPDADFIRERLSYDEHTGAFFWKRTDSTRVKPGDLAGSINGRGYHLIKIGPNKYSAHRLAWLYVYGTWPDLDIDHINRIKSDNRIENLRLATRSQNKRNAGAYANNLSGYKGVSRLPSGNYRSSFWDGARNVCVGHFDTAEKAAAAYINYARPRVGVFLFTHEQPRPVQMEFVA